MSSEAKVGHAEIVASMVSAVSYGDLEKVKELLDQYGLSYCPSLVRGYILLCHAIDQKHLELVKLLLEKGANVNCEINQNSQYSEKFIRINYPSPPAVAHKLADNYTPLHIACDSSGIDWGQSEVVVLLVKSGAYVNAETVEKKTPLHLATTNGDLQIIETLITGEAQVNCKEFYLNYTPLHIACQLGQGATVDFLLRRGADVNVKAKDGVTPLHIAVDGCESEIVEILIKFGAQINCARHSDYYTPLQIACENWDREVVASHALDWFKAVQQLLESGADPNMKTSDNITPLHVAAERGHTNMTKLLLKHGALVNCTRLFDNCTPLHLACKRGCLKVAALLIEKGADTNAKSNNNENPLHFAPNRGYWSGKLCAYLIKQGTQVNCSRFSDNYTPLHVACSRVREKAVLELLKNGADPNAKAIADVTPLHLASMGNYSKIVELLIKYGSEVNCIGLYYNKTPLYIACEESKETHVSVLLKKGADPNIKANDCSTPLHIAVSAKFFNSIETVKTLIKRGAEVNCSRLSDGYTPLHAACEMKSLRADVAVDILLNNGADPNVSAHNGTAPLHLACKIRNSNTVDMLLKKSADINAETCEGFTALDLASQNNQGDQVHQPPIGALNQRPDNACLDLLKKQVILLKVAGLYVNEKNLKFIQHDDSKLQAYQLECEKEIEKMKCEIVSDLFTVYDILRHRQIPVYARSVPLMKRLKSFNYDKFPRNQNHILSCLEGSKQRIELLFASEKALGALLKTSAVLNKNKIRALPVELQIEIVSYFRNHELQSLISFGEDLKHQFSKFSGNTGEA